MTNGRVPDFQGNGGMVLLRIVADWHKTQTMVRMLMATACNT